jgi:hypothetical protein
VLIDEYLKKPTLMVLWSAYLQINVLPVLRIRIRDPVPFDPWIRDPGWVESQHPDPGSGMNNPYLIF